MVTRRKENCRFTRTTWFYSYGVARIALKHKPSTSRRPTWHVVMKRFDISTSVNSNRVAGAGAGCCANAGKGAGNALFRSGCILRSGAVLGIAAGFFDVIGGSVAVAHQKGQDRE